jgi:molybdopterin/thiamine biosynthesis adenylyltransferase
VLGRDAQLALQKANVIVVGCSGPGVELAKNVALAGVAALGLCDPTPCTWRDLASHFYATPADVLAGVSRAEAAAKHVASLNPHVKVTVVVPPGYDPTSRSGTGVSAAGAAALVACGGWAVAVAVDQPLAVQLAMNDAARDARTNRSPSQQQAPRAAAGAGPAAAAAAAARCAFVACGARGVFGSVFCDFGDGFVVRDPTGAQPEPKPLDDLRVPFQPASRRAAPAAGAQANAEGVEQTVHEAAQDVAEVEVEVVEGERHGLSAGQRVHLADLTWAAAPAAEANSEQLQSSMHEGLEVSLHGTAADAEARAR